MAYTNQTFLETLKPYVIRDMKENNILASLTAAQAFIESGKGNSTLTRECNNLFGIKGEYNGQFGTYWTTEYYNGVACRVRAAFRKYPSWQESVNDHSGLFNRLKRYKNLRGCTDYQKACVYVQQDGYATAPDYASTLLKTINKFKLYTWDAEVLGTTITPVEPPKAVQKKIAMPVLKVGSRGEHVRNWQILLNRNGYYCGLEDGKFGKNTELAVKAWQVSKGIKADGIIGAETWATVGL